MPGITLITGAHTRYYPFENAIKEQLSVMNGSWLSLLPVNRAVRHFKRRLVDAFAPRALADPPVFTFEGFALDYYRRLPHMPHVLPPDTLYFILEEILKQKTEAFSYFPSAAAGISRLVYRISDVVEELRRFGFTAEKLARHEFDPALMPPARQKDLVMILQTLEERLAGHYIDQAGAVFLAVKAMTAGNFKKQYPDLKTVYINGYGIFTPPMYLFLEQLKETLDFTIRLEYVDENPTLFAGLAPLRRRLLHMGAREVADARPSFISRKLFNRDHPPLTAQEPPYPLTLTVAEDAEDEIECIAAKIESLRRQGVAAHRIGLTFPNLEHYVPRIRRIFSREEIPFNLSTGYALDKAPLIETLTRLLEVVRDDFPVDDVLALLGSPFLKGELPTAYRRLYKILAEKRRGHLRPGWHKNLTFDDEALSSAVAVIQEFLQPLYRFGTAKRDLDEWHRDMRRLFRSTGAFRWYENPRPDGLPRAAREKEYRAYNRFMKILEPFFWSLKQVWQKEPMGLSALISRLKMVLGRASYSLTEWPDHGVQIMPRLEIQALECDVLLVGGLTDGQFPRVSVKDIFLSDPAREQLGLTASEELLDQDRFLFYLLLDAPLKQAHLFYPQYEGERALVPSTFLDELRNCWILRDVERAPVEKQDGWRELGSSFQAVDWEASFRRGSDLLRTQPAGKKTGLDVLRRIRVDRDRHDAGQPFGLYEGDLSRDERIAALSRDRFARHLWSITQLESYAFCPMKYFLERQLKLEEWPEFENGITALEKGNLIHEILYAFYSKWKKQPLLHTDRQSLVRELKKLAGQKMDEQPFSGFLWELEKSRWLGDDKRPSLLHLFLEHDLDAMEHRACTPAMLEWAFGQEGGKDVDETSSARPLILEKEGQTIRISGKIDRIDRDAADRLIVYDYKTGHVSSPGKLQRMMARGLHFQLPVYWMALEQFMYGNPVLMAALYSIRNSADVKQLPALGRRADSEQLGVSANHLQPNKNFTDEEGTPLELPQLLNRVEEQIFKLNEQAAAGIFSHSAWPDEEPCRSFCAFKRLCQKHPAKMKRTLTRSEL